MTSDLLRIRRADAHDARALWLWANDPLTRQASGDRAVIPWPDHVDWLNTQLESPNVVILIAEADSGQPIGSARFDTVDDWASARLSYVIAPEARGKNCSRPMLQLALDFVQTEKQPGTVFADVLPGNDRSLRVFRTLGWNDITGAGDRIRRFQQSLRSLGEQR